MKKVLSVLLTVTMLLGCLSVGFVSFAAAPADEAAMAQALKDTTTYATTKTPVTVNAGQWNENTYFSLPASYSFSRIVNKTISTINDSNVTAAADAYNATLAEPVADAYNELVGAYVDDETCIVRDSNGTITKVYAANYINSLFNFENTIADYITPAYEPTTVNPGTTGINPLGENALKVIEIDPADMLNYNTANGSFSIADIVIRDDTDATVVTSTIEDSAITSIVAMPETAQADALLATIKQNANVADATNYKYAITDILVTPTLKTVTLTEPKTVGDVEYAAGDTFTTITKIDVSYRVSYSADVRFNFSDVSFPYSAQETVKISYSNIKEVQSEVTAAEVIDIINAATAAAAEATETDAGYQHASGYDFNRQIKVVEAMHTEGMGAGEMTASTTAILNNIIDDKYPEYSDYKDAETGAYLFDNMIITRLGLDGMFGRTYDLNPDADQSTWTYYGVTKGVNGVEILDIDALKAMEIDASKIKDYMYSGQSAQIIFNDEEMTDETVIADMYDNITYVDEVNAIADDFAMWTKGSSIENLKVKYENITLNASLATVNGESVVTSLTLSYDINYTADLYLTDIVNYETVTGIYNVTVNYFDIDKFEEGTDIDPYEFAEILNQATAYTLDEKAGYDFERNASFIGEPAVDLSTIDSIGMIIGLLDGTLGLSATVKDYILADMDVTDFSGSVPATADGIEYLGENYAFKATCIEPNDLKNLQFNEAKGVVTYELRDEINPEKDEMSPLSRLTNDFTAASELRSKLGLQIAGDLGVSFIGDDEPCDVKYTNIKGYVAFADADADNIYGDGTIATLGLNYDCNLSAVFSGATLTADETMKSVYTNFNYCDYEMGDVDMSTRVSIVDAKLVLKAVAGLTELEGKSFELADMNYDGKISVVDAKKILQKIAYGA